MAFLLTAFAGFIVMRFVTVGIWREGEPGEGIDGNGQPSQSETTA